VPAATAVGSTGEPGRAGEDAHSAIWAGLPAGCCGPWRRRPRPAGWFQPLSLSARAE